jgi:DNA-binding protein HU-beta
MSKKFIAQVVQDSAELSGVAANRVASDLITAIVKEMKKEGGFTLQGFGTFRVAKTKARKGLNPATGEAMMIKASKTVRFKASKVLRASV